MEEADAENDLPPLASQGVLLEEVSGDLGEGPAYVGAQAFGWLVGHLGNHNTTGVNHV